MKYKTSIDQMERAPIYWTIWEYKEQGMLGTKCFPENMIDPFIKHKLYIMPMTNDKSLT
jgi:hypothetical protein